MKLRVLWFRLGCSTLPLRCIFYASSCQQSQCFHSHTSSRQLGIRSLPSIAACTQWRLHFGAPVSHCWANQHLQPERRCRQVRYNMTLALPFDNPALCRWRQQIGTYHWDKCTSSFGKLHIDHKNQLQSSRSLELPTWQSSLRCWMTTCRCGGCHPCPALAELDDLRRLQHLNWTRSW